MQPLYSNAINFWFNINYTNEVFIEFDFNYRLQSFSYKQMNKIDSSQINSCATTLYCNILLCFATSTSW